MLNARCRTCKEITGKLNLSESGNLLPWMYQKHVDMNYKDVSIQSSLLPMLCTEAVYGGKLFRDRYLGPASFRDHIGPHSTPNSLATGSHPTPKSTATLAPEAHHPLLPIW